LEGNIQEGNTFYEDKHNLVAGADFVMANPPFNVDGVDKAKDAVKKDPRLMLDGKVNLPKNDNANYLWIQYFYNYLKPTGRAGFVMASSASDAGHSEKDIREKLVKTGAVDVMMAIGNNFFYTRSLPCTLWFFDRAKEQDEAKKDKVLMLDARKIYRKVTSKVNDFSPEQLQNLICIVNLYRGNTQKLESTIRQYLQTAIKLASDVLTHTFALQKVMQQLLIDASSIITKIDNGELIAFKELMDITLEDENDIYKLQHKLMEEIKTLSNVPQNIEQVAHLCKAIRKPQDKLIKQIAENIANGQRKWQLNKIKEWKDANIKDILDTLKNIQQQLSGNPDEGELGLLYETDYFYKQAQWLTSRFPEGVYTDVEGLCKVVIQQEIEAKDWSLSPGRYVGVDTSTDEDFDYEERLNEIHIDL
jgi:type I restriction enzyme M protein